MTAAGTHGAEPSTNRSWALDWESRPADHHRADVADVAAGAGDEVFVLTRRDAGVLVYDRDGQFLRRVGDGQLTSMPHGITVDRSGHILVVLEDDQSVRILDAAGGLVRQLGTSGVLSDTGCDWSQSDGPSFKARVDSIVRGAEPFNHPTGAAVACDGSIFVSDGYGNARVHRFGIDGSLQTSWGRPGIGPGEFHVPHNLTVTRDNQVVVADRENGRLQIFDVDGNHVRTIADLHRPSAVAEGPDGYLYVTEFPQPAGWYSWTQGWFDRPTPGRLSILRPDGHLVDRIDQPGAGRRFIAPHGIAVLSDGTVLVAEVTGSFIRGRVQFGDDSYGDPAQYPTLHVLPP